MLKINALKFFDPNKDLLNQIGIDVTSSSYKSAKKGKGEHCRLVNESKYRKVVVSSKNPIFINGKELSATKNNIEISVPNASALVEITSGVTSGVRGLYVKINDGDVVSEIWKDINCHRLCPGYTGYSLRRLYNHTMMCSFNPNSDSRAIYKEIVNNGTGNSHIMQLLVGTMNNVDITKGAVVSATMSPNDMRLYDSDYYFNPCYLDYFAGKLKESKAVSDLIIGVYTNTNKLIPGLSDYIEANYPQIIPDSFKQSAPTIGIIPNIAESINNRSKLIRRKLKDN